MNSYWIPKGATIPNTYFHDTVRLLGWSFSHFFFFLLLVLRFVLFSLYFYFSERNY